MPRRLALACTVLTLLLAGLVAAGPASAAAVPHTPIGLPTAIEPLAPYVAQSECDPTTKAGTAKLAALLVATYPGTTYNTTYACGTDGSVSEHYDGRAIDWMVSIRNATQYADAKALISWLLATDSHGNRNAMARRLGVMYLIYDNRIWGSWDGTWQPYNNCATQPTLSYDSACHRNHMHISLAWNGANGRTTFWTRQLYPTDYGPCRVRGLNWAPTSHVTNTIGCVGYPTVTALAGSSATKVALVRYSGAGILVGSRGPAVVAVQQALHVIATGYYGSLTQAAVTHFQAGHRLTQTGAMGPATWLALLPLVH